MPTASNRLLELLWIRALKPNGFLPMITLDRVREVRALIISWTEEDNG